MSDVIGLEVSALQIGVTPPGRTSDPVLPHTDEDHRPRLHGSIGAMCDDVAAMGSLVEIAIERVTTAVAHRDVELCAAVIAGDAEINALQQRVRESCYRVIVTQAPLARDLRTVMAAMQMGSELERMGDHCVSVAKQARALADLPEAPVPEDLTTLGTLCARQVQDVLGAVVRRDAEEARAVAKRDDVVDRIYHRLVERLVAALPSDADAAFRVTSLLLVAHHLERIGDRVTNIAEDVIFAATGEVLDLG